MAPLQEESIPIDFSNIFNKDQNFRIDKAKFQSDVQTDGNGEFIANSIEMTDLLFHFLPFLYDRRLVVYFDRFFHPFIFELLYLRTKGDTWQFESDFIAIDASGEQLQRIPIAKTEQIVNLWYNNTHDSVLLLLPQIICLQRTAYDDMLILYLPHLLHVKIHYRNFRYARKNVVQRLGKVLRMAQKNNDSLFLINKLLHGEEHQSYGLARALGGGDDEVVHVGFDLKKLLLKISSNVDFQFVETAQDRWVVPEEITDRFFLLHHCCWFVFAIL